MNKVSIEAAFLDWWQDTYPHLHKPSPDLMSTHVEFTAHVLDLLELISPYQINDQ